MTGNNKQSFGILGVGAAACIACCAVPIVGLIAASGLLTATSFAVLGTVGLGMAVPGIALIVRRRRHRAACSPTGGPVAVAAPTRRR